MLPHLRGERPRAMPNRLREKYLKEAVEAIIRYAADDGVMHYQSDSAPDGALRITFDLADAERYQAILTTVMSEDAPTR
jgi:hypothetical protein